MQFLESEQRDATRLAWCTWPSTRLEASRLVVPLSAVYQPLKPIETLAQMQYDPVSHPFRRGSPSRLGPVILYAFSVFLTPFTQVHCKGASCGAILNPWCQVNYHTKIWTCPFCLMPNQFPHHYSDISPESNPAV